MLASIEIQGLTIEVPGLLAKVELVTGALELSGVSAMRVKPRNRVRRFVYL
jgi:hypothetical protein